jgi:hypothetical protein
MTINFMKRTFPKTFPHDFIKHIGTQTCLYACPALNIVTHGFDAAIVEAVVRRVIAKYFELIDAGLSCSPAEKKFFNRYKRDYYKEDSQFMNFMQV